MANTTTPVGKPARDVRGHRHHGHPEQLQVRLETPGEGAASRALPSGDSTLPAGSQITLRLSVTAA
jgi:hypothetical protein